MLRRVGTAVGLFGVHLCASVVAVVASAADLMSPGIHWLTGALSGALFLPLLATEFAGLGLMERSLPLALAANSAVSVGVFLAGRRAVRARRRCKSEPNPRCT